MSNRVEMNMKLEQDDMEGVDEREWVSVEAFFSPLKERVCHWKHTVELDSLLISHSLPRMKCKKTLKKTIVCNSFHSR